jgi:hypothetical protein
MDLDGELHSLADLPLGKMPLVSVGWVVDLKAVAVSLPGIETRPVSYQNPV